MTRGAPPSTSLSSASLERRLPLMISGLLVVTLTAFGFLAFSELKQSSVSAAILQVRTLMAQSVENAVRGMTLRGSILGTMAEQPAVIRATSPAATPNDFAAATKVLKARPAADSAILVAALMIDAQGTHHTLLGDDVVAADMAVLEQARAEASRRDSIATSVLYAIDSTMRFWVVIPVHSAGKTVGFVAEQRRVRGSANVEQQIKTLTGQDLAVYYTAIGGDVWTGLRGVPIAPKFDVTAVPDSFEVVGNDGQVLIGAKATLPGTPIVMVFVVNETSVQRPAYTFLRRMIVTGALLLGLGILGAWWVSRRVTAPLKSLTGAARQIAMGNYAVREPIRTSDELGELAQAFNGMAKDIGESHAQLGVRIRESEALAHQLHQASIAKSEFLAMMSHELRTPLSAIAGYAEILQLGMRGKLNEAQQLDLSRIQANQVHLLRIINDILDLAQVESGQLQVSTQPVAVSDVVHDLEPIVLPLVAGRDINYTVHKNVNELVVNAERDRLTQVLVNLVANAVRFTDARGSISIHGTQAGEKVRLNVTDTGIGIPSDKHEAIFQPFVQAEGGASRRAQGTGLGLAISRRIVEALGGTLTVASVPGQGSTFTIELQAASLPRANNTVGHLAPHKHHEATEAHAHALS